MSFLLVFEKLGIALGLGLLVGLQREHVTSPLGGIRTYPLVTLLGAVSALLAQTFGGWVLAAAFVAVAAVIVIGNVDTMRAGPVRPGLTTEFAILLMFGVGAYLVAGYAEVAVALGAGAAVLLELKAPMHAAASRLGDDDLRAIMTFALVSLVILPVLPDRTYGPYAVLNPHQIWLMVVLIVGLSVAGYVAYKFLGARVSTLLGGVVGGLVSSTATAVSYAKRCAQASAATAPAAAVIVIASVFSFLRILVLIGVTAPDFLAEALPPLATVLLVTALLAVLLWRRAGTQPAEVPVQKNPSELRSALGFALVFAVVLLVVAAARDRFGTRGLYVVAGLSGIEGVDAITLSAAGLVRKGEVEAAVGWRVILVAAMSNLVLKAAIVGALGNRRLLATVAGAFALVLAAGIAVVFLWPA